MNPSTSNAPETHTTEDHTDVDLHLSRSTSNGRHRNISILKKSTYKDEIFTIEEEDEIIEEISSGSNSAPSQYEEHITISKTKNKDGEVLSIEDTIEDINSAKPNSAERYHQEHVSILKKTNHEDEIVTIEEDAIEFRKPNPKSSGTYQKYASFLKMKKNKKEGRVTAHEEMELGDLTAAKPPPKVASIHSHRTPGYAMCPLLLSPFVIYAIVYIIAKHSLVDKV